MINDPSSALSMALGIFAPIVIAWLVSFQASQRFKSLLAFGFCVIVALVSMLFANQFISKVGVSGIELVKLYLQNLLLVLIAAWNFYARFWKPIGVTGELEQRGGTLGK